jgi:nicotinamide-nucleotide amidase
VRASDVIGTLVARGETVATCESVTGGLVSGTLTDVPGASQVLRGGLITYATDLKTALAGVDAAVIATSGVVSAAVAAAMAQGVRRVCRADWGIGVTGVAGPGPSDGVPAGTVWLGLAGPAGCRTQQVQVAGTRGEVRAAAVGAALTLLADGLADTARRPVPIHGGPR